MKEFVNYIISNLERINNILDEDYILVDSDVSMYMVFRINRSELMSEIYSNPECDIISKWVRKHGVIQDIYNEYIRMEKIKDILK